MTCLLAQRLVFLGLGLNQALWKIKLVVCGLGLKTMILQISRSLFIRSSHQKDFHSSLTAETNIAYFAAECKTNLDKTMFQEATATALDVKLTVPGAKYYLLCEWLDMSPISTNTTAIDEILILRKAKRLASDVRQAFSTVEGRKRNREKYVKYLESNPFSTGVFMRFLDHVRSVVDENPENEVLMRGFF